MIQSIRSKALKKFWIKGDSSSIRPEWRTKVRIVMSALDAAKCPTDLNITGFGFHALTGDMAGRFAIVVSRNWRITFGCTDNDATDVDLEDYHGG